MLKRISLVVTALILLCIGTAFAADGTSKGNIFQVITGFLTLVVGGGGAFVYSKIKLIKDLREAVGSTVQALSAVTIFAKRAPESIKAIPEYNDMMSKVDTGTEEIADVLEGIKPVAKYAPMLRNLIRESMYVNSKESTINMIKQQYREHSDLLDIFDEALEDMKK